jgi:hypothetical protein
MRGRPRPAPAGGGDGGSPAPPGTPSSQDLEPSEDRVPLDELDGLAGHPALDHPLEPAPGRGGHLVVRLDVLDAEREAQEVVRFDLLAVLLPMVDVRRRLQRRDGAGEDLGGVHGARILPADARARRPVR